MTVALPGFGRDGKRQIRKLWSQPTMPSESCARTNRMQLGQQRFTIDERARRSGQLDSGGNVLAKYVQSPGIDEPLAESRSSTMSCYEADGLGSVTSLTNPSGALTTTYSCDSLGTLVASSATITNPSQHASRNWDSGTGLYYNRARYYDPRVVRFSFPKIPWALRPDRISTPMFTTIRRT